MKHKEVDVEVDVVILPEVYENSKAFWSYMGMYLWKKGQDIIG